MANTEELGLEVFVEGWRRFEQIMDRLDDSIDDTAKSMGKTGSIAGGAFAVALGTIAVNAAMALGRALLDAGRAVFEFGAESLQMAADFQGQMAILEIAASSTGLSFDQLHDAALQVGGDTRLMGVSATGAADAMTGLFKAGLSNVEVFGDLQGFMDGTAELGGALRASIDLAAASELDMVQASDLAAVALASFGAELETETERAEFINAAMDNMVQAADASVAEVSDLAQALTMVGPSAGAAGISIQDTNNALALLSTRGIAGSRAGTSLDAMFRSLTDTTPKAQEAMDALGISVFDMDGEMRPLVDIIGQFETTLGDATDAQRAAALGAIFTAQGQRAMNTLLSEGVEGWDDMATATANAAGIQEQAAARSQTFNAQMEALEGTVETLKIGIGEQFLPIAQELAVWFSEMVNQHGPAIQAIFAAVAVVISDVARFLIGLLETGDPLNAFFLQLPEPIQAFVTFMTDEFMPAMAEVWGFVLEQVAVVVAWFQANLPLITAEGERVKEQWVAFAEAMGVVWEVIKEIIGASIQVILQLLTAGMQIMQHDWEGAWESIKAALVSAVAGILTISETLFEGIANTMGTTMPEIRETWASNWEMLKIIVIDILNSASTAVTQALEIIRFTIVDTLNRAATAAGQLIGIFRQVGSDLINGMVEGIKAEAARVANAAREVVNSAIAAAQSALGIESPSKVFFAIGDDLGQGLIDGINSTADGVADAIEGLFGIGGTLGSVGGAVASRLKRLQLDPLTARLKDMRQKLKELREEREKAEAVEIAKFGTILDDRKHLESIRAEANLENEIARASAEQLKLNKQLLALEKQRKDLAFLKQQSDLLDLIREHGLDAGEILGGLELGINASLEGIVQAMSSAMQAIITQVESELEIASPSRVFSRIGQRMMEGLSRGVARFAPIVQAQIQAVVQAPAQAMAGGGGDVSSAVTNIFNLTTNSAMRPGGLSTEFQTMSFAGR